MKYNTAKEMAAVWGVSLRAVQSWAKAGKIPGSNKVGRDWLIPEGAACPLISSEKSALSGIEDVKTGCFAAMPLMNGVFEPGKAMEYIEFLTESESRGVALSEYYYFSGQAAKASSESQKLLCCKDKALRLSALLVHSFSNIELENIRAARRDFAEIQAEIKKKSQSDEEKAVSIFISSLTSVLLHNIDSEHIELESFVKYLPGGMKLYSLYALAHLWYLKGEYGRSLGIVESGLALLCESRPIPMIYLNLMAAMDCMNLQQTDRGKEYFNKAWNIAVKDCFLQPFGEHHGLLQGLIELLLRRSEPQLYERVIDITYRFSKGWRKIHNPDTNDEVADSLTTTEFSIAMLVSKKWTIAQIAAHMELSERMVKNHIAAVYQKLGVQNRNELKRYMLK